MAPEKKAIDQKTRDLVTGRLDVSDLDTTFLLEAGAGSGKTRVLVDRYVACVLDPRHDPGDVGKVAAITFTEKAAGELRQRIREEFERRASLAGKGTDEAAVIDRALDGLDDAPVSTIHGFAGRLLREFPVEARVDPAFEQLDALGSEIELTRLWEDWLTELAGDGAPPVAIGGATGGDTGAAAGTAAGDGTPASQARAWLSRLLRAGVRLDDVQKLAAGPKGLFGERYDIDVNVCPPGEPDLASGLAGLAGPLDCLREYCRTACTDPEDNGFKAAMKLVEACEAVLAEPPADTDRLAAGLLSLPVKKDTKGPGGNKANWSAGHGGKDVLVECFVALADTVNELREQYAAFVTGLAIAVACAFVRWAGDRLLEAGSLDFADLLGRLRDLLKGAPPTGVSAPPDLSARRALQGRFRYVLVDEFQDTDPLQAEIVFFLCEREPKAADWRDVELEPGKLFVVGDPKQSIYRFRRADIALWDEVKELVGERTGGLGSVEKLSQNFRTTPDVVGWVNGVFAETFVEERHCQPLYQGVEPYRDPVDGPGVSVLLGGPYGTAAGAADASRRDEARALAALLCRMHGADAARWQVQDRDKRSEAAADAGAPGAPTGGSPANATVDQPMRPPRWGDIALLFRVTTDLETYEQALREAGVPYRVDGGKAYFSRREVDDALLCLRAVDDPADGPAVYGALHSSLFGFSDDELFLFWNAGGRFDPFAASQPAGFGPVAEALSVLRRLHESRAGREPHELVSELARLAHAPEFLAATGPGAAQAIANLDKLVERARAYTEAGGGGLGEFLAWAAQAGDTSGESESQVDDDADVVHLLTVHKAKGLEFPIVALVGGARAGGGGGGEPILDRENRAVAIKLKAALPGARPRDLEPQGYTDLKQREKKMSDSEALRLLYVATTRARDRLVVCCFGDLLTKAGDPRSGVLLAPIAGRLPEPAVITEEYVHESGLLVLPPGEPPARDERDEAPDAATLINARAAWNHARAQLLAVAAKPARATSPSGLEQVDDDVRTGGPGAPAGRAGALALGSAVHRVMELCDLGDESSLERVVPGVSAEIGRDDLAAEVLELARACWRAAPVRAAARAAADPGAVVREMSVGALVGDAIVSGAVDLLYRDGDQWVVVDYKTDRAADETTLRARYTPQGAAYVVAVEAALAASVREVVFVAARAGGLSVVVPVDDALRAFALREVETAAGSGHAVSPDELERD